MNQKNLIIIIVLKKKQNMMILILQTIQLETMLELRAKYAGFCYNPTGITKKIALIILALRYNNYRELERLNKNRNYNSPDECLNS